MGKKVCILTSVHPPFDTRIFHKQAKTLVKAGYDVTLIAQHDRDEVVDGVRIIALPKPRNRFWRMVGTWQVFRLAHRQKADIYHFHDPELLPTGLLLKLLTRGKVIYDVHEDYPKKLMTKYWIPSIARIPVSHAFDLLEKSMSCLLDCTIAVSDVLAQKFSKCQTATVMNYPILESIKPRLGDSSMDPIIIYVGALTEERGITEIVQAMEYLDPSMRIKLVLYGKFFTKSYQDKFRRLSGFDKVAYMGWLEPQDVWLKIAQASMGIVCLRPVVDHPEAIPTKLLEYMAAGLPVIASNFPLWKRIVEGNKCGLTVNPLDPNEIAKAVEYLINHPDEAKIMGENGRRVVIEKYNWETESRKLLAVYEELLKGRATHCR